MICATDKVNIIHCGTKTPEKHGKHFFLVVIHVSVPFKVECVLKRGWIKSWPCLLGFSELFIIQSRKQIRM